MRERRILVAEDSAALAAVIRMNLVHAGLSVTVARDGGEAWRHLQASTFDLLLTDQQMPVLEGCELCRRMRSDPRHAGMPALMLTGKGLELHFETLRTELGVQELIAKPFSPRELVQTVLRYLPVIPADMPLRASQDAGPVLQSAD